MKGTELAVYAACCFVAGLLWGFLLCGFVGCAPSSDVTFDDAQPVCGDSLCLETRGVTEDEVYLGGACEVGTGEGTDLSACCPEGYDAVGYCDVTEHIVACVVACDDV